MAKLKQFRIIASVEASGSQMYLVDARDAKHARELFDAGEHGECVSEELEVEKITDVDVTEVKVVDL